MKAVSKIFISLGALCILSAVVLTLLYGFTVGNAIALTAGAALTSLGWFWPRLPIWLKCAVWTGVFAFFAMVCVISFRGNRDTTVGTEDYVLVLGCGIRGEQVLPTLAARLDRCVEYVAQNPTAPIVVSGGQGSREAITEAAAMKKYLVERGIDPSRIFMEQRARNTIENMQFSKIVMDSLAAGENYSVACVTSRYHVMRAEGIARRTGLDARFAGAPTDWWLWPSAWSREVLSVVKSFGGKI